MNVCTEEYGPRSGLAVTSSQFWEMEDPFERVRRELIVPGLCQSVGKTIRNVPKNGSALAALAISCRLWLDTPRRRRPFRPWGCFLPAPLTVRPDIKFPQVRLVMQYIAVMDEHYIPFESFIT